MASLSASELSALAATNESRAKSQSFKKERALSDEGSHSGESFTS